MGHATSTLERIWRATVRVSLFFLVWTVAVCAVTQAVAQGLEHRQLTMEVQQLEQEYDAQLATYADQLAENERIANDRERQIELLKDRFGYAEPNETPIVILSEE
jgi:hypothetical protein